MVFQVLDVASKAARSSSTVYQSASCELLKCLASKTLDNDSNQKLVCDRISLLISQLLKSNNPCMKQLALETFSYFAYVTKYERIVPETVANDSKLQSEITNYFEAVPLAESNISFLEHMKTLKGNFVHKCESQKKTKLKPTETILDDNPSKKLKVTQDESVSCILHRIVSDISLIEQNEGRSRLNEEQLLMINNVLRKLEKLVEES